MAGASDSPNVGADAADPELDALSFEAILERLQKVVAQLETGELALEESLKAFELGVRLSRAGQKRLDEAERRIEVLLNSRSGEAVTAPLEPPESNDE